MVTGMLSSTLYNSAACTVDKVNVTNYSALEVTWESTSGPGMAHSFGLSAYKDVTHAPGDENIAFINKTGVFVKTTDTISLAEKSGEYYIKSRPATGSAAGSESVYKVTLTA